MVCGWVLVLLLCLWRLNVDLINWLKYVVKSMF